ncbi:hypothetical protein LJR289_002970 [Pseudoduganella sp. LjRoot289]|uniref:hypothetical protein n=1 Tax=Pseudoduganella sp. LjRoot289 TaxID=3342314 RepID=UPI003ECCF0B9
MSKNPIISRAIRGALLAAGAFAIIVSAASVQAGPMNWLRGGDLVQGRGKVVKQR